MDDLRAHRSSLEYWFFAFGTGELRLLVDFIARRPKGAPASVEVRVSRWLREAGDVERSTGLPGAGHLVGLEGSWLDARGSAGAVGAVSWQVAWATGSASCDITSPLGPIVMTDLELVAHPHARFEGWVDVAGERFDVADRPGTVTQYWGRRLMDRWTWISAAEFPDDPDLRVEASWGVSRAFGHGPGIPVGYVWIGDARHGERTLMPITGLVRVREESTAERWTTTLRSMRIDGRRHVLRVSAPVGAFNRLEPEIATTLSADLIIDGHAATPGTVGFERRSID